LGRASECSSSSRIHEMGLRRRNDPLLMSEFNQRVRWKGDQQKTTYGRCNTKKKKNAQKRNKKAGDIHGKSDYHPDTERPKKIRKSPISHYSRITNKGGEEGRKACKGV